MPLPSLLSLYLNQFLLALPNATDPLILDTDASDRSVGAELIQIQGEKRGQWHRGVSR
jgi:hypothetical protein